VLVVLRWQLYGEIVPGTGNWPRTFVDPLGGPAMTVTFPPAELGLPSGIVTTKGLLPRIVAPRDCNCPDAVAVKNVNELPAGTTDESKAKTAFVPETNPGTALLDADATGEGSCSPA